MIFETLSCLVHSIGFGNFGCPVTLDPSYLEISWETFGLAPKGGYACPELVLLVPGHGDGVVGELGILAVFSRILEDNICWELFIFFQIGVLSTLSLSPSVVDVVGADRHTEVHIEVVPT